MISNEMKKIKITLNDLAERKIDQDVEKHIETLFLDKYEFNNASNFFLSIAELAYVLLFYRRFLRISN